jgi:hypothetical protein
MSKLNSGRVEGGTVAYRFELHSGLCACAISSEAWHHSWTNTGTVFAEQTKNHHQVTLKVTGLR